MNINSYRADHTFYGGSALLVQYHDIIKPVYFLALLKLILNKKLRCGLEFSHLERFSLPSIIEAYVNRSFINPLYLGDPAKKAKPSDLDKLLEKLLNDFALYSLAPTLETNKIVAAIDVNKLGIPIYYYSERYDKNIEKEAKQIPSVYYISGPIKDVVSKIPNNFSMIFSNIELAKEVFYCTSEKTIGSIMVSSDYQYNYNSKGQPKIDFNKEIIKTNHIFMKVSSISIFDKFKVMKEIQKIMENF